MNKLQYRRGLRRLVLWGQPTAAFATIFGIGLEKQWPKKTNYALKTKEVRLTTTNKNRPLKVARDHWHDDLL